MLSELCIYLGILCLADERTQFQHVQSTYLPLPTPRVNKNVVNDTVCCYFSMLLVYLYTQACPADNYLSICEALVDILAQVKQSSFGTQMITANFF